MKSLPAWYKATGIVVLLMFVAVNVYYRLGAGGIQVSGSSVSFDRHHDFALFRIDDRLAFLLTKSGFVSVVRYKRGTFPFCPVCGLYEPAGMVLSLAQYKKDNWVYTGHPDPKRVCAVNLKTGEALKAGSAPVARPGLKVDVSQIAVYRENGLTLEERHRLSPSAVAKKFKSLSTINESCFVFNAAFFLVLGAMLILGIVFLIRGWVSRSAQA